MISDWKFDFVVDPKLPEMPYSIELKRVLLIALRCVDPDTKSRPRMGDVIHMLEPRDRLLIDVRTLVPEFDHLSLPFNLYHTLFILHMVQIDQIQTESSCFDHLQENEENSSNHSQVMKKEGEIEFSCSLC